MQERRNEVIKVAQELFLDKGYVQTSIQDIIDVANISKGTFYNYFSSKNECLLAILINAQVEATDRRKKLLIDRKKTDKNIFAKQIVIRMQVNREQNLLPLLGFVFHSKDKELRKFAESYHLDELIWLSERFIDVYGEAIRPYSIDCAAFVLGLSQQYSLIWSFFIKEEMNTDDLIRFVLDKMEAVVADFIQDEKSFIHPSFYKQIDHLRDGNEESKLALHLLYDFEDELVEGKAHIKEYLELLKEELAKEKLRQGIVTLILDKLEQEYSSNQSRKKIADIRHAIQAIKHD